MLKLFYLKVKYHFNKNLFFLLEFYFIKKILRLCYFFFNYLWFISFVIEEDIYTLKLKRNSFKEIYFNFGFFKHLLFLFLFITGVIPLLLFVYVIFFFTKYLFKYLFITLDYIFFYSKKPNYIYNNIKNFINKIFYVIPNILLNIYRYFFGGGWLKFFWEIFKNYWKKKWFRFLNFFFTITDEFFLVSVPKIYSKLCEKLSDLYYWLLIKFFKYKKIVYDNIRFYRNFFFKILRYPRRIQKRIIRKTRRPKRTYDYLVNKYYYLWYMRYIRAFIYYAWIFRKYIWSDAFVVTCEAFTFIAFWNLVAVIKYSIALLFTRLQYIYSKIFYSFWMKWIFIEFPLKNFKEYLYEKIRRLKGYIKNLLLELIRSFIFNISTVAVQLIYYDPYNWYWWEHECYEVDKGYISIMWRSYKFYAVIQKFFRRLYPTPIRLFFYNKKFYKVIYLTIYGYLIRIIFRRFIEGCYNMFYLKYIYHI